MKIEIKNGRLIDPATNRNDNASLYIADGLVVGMGTSTGTGTGSGTSTGEVLQGFTPDKVIDASGKIVCPGLVDLCARLREPGFEYRATLESEMRAAVAGGVTSLVCPPDTDPVLDEPGLVEMLKRRATMANLARVYPLGALTLGLNGKKLAEMTELREAGCVGFFQADHPIHDTMVLYRALQYAATFGYTVWLRPQEAYLAADGMAHDGEVATRLGLAGIPVSAETVAIAAIITLMRETGAKVHLARLSSWCASPNRQVWRSAVMLAFITCCSRIAISATLIRSIASPRRCAARLIVMRSAVVSWMTPLMPSALTIRRMTTMPNMCLLAKLRPVQLRLKRYCP